MNTNNKDNPDNPISTKPLNTFADLQAFLSKISDIRDMPEEQKYRHVYLTISRFCDLCQVNTSIVANVALDLMISASLGDAKGNIDLTKRNMLEILIPELTIRINKLTFDDIEPVNTGVSKLDIVAAIHDNKPDGKVH